MKKFAVLFVIFANIMLFAQQPMNHNSVVEINENEVNYEQNKLLIKLYDKFADIDLSSESGISNSAGISAIALLNQEYRVQSVKKLFPFVRKINMQPHDLTTIYEIEYEHEIDPQELAKIYVEIPEIEFAEPDYIASILVSPNDPYYSDGSQWYHDDVHAEDAWELTTGDASQIIAIIDTGVDWEHDDLEDNIWVNQAELDGEEGVDDDGNGFVDDIRGWDFVNDDNNPTDDNSHGTHVAGIAGAKTNNNLGIAGIAWNAKLMPVKVMQSSGRGSWSDVAQGAAYAAENGSTVINMSLGGYTESLTMKTTLENAYHYSVLVAAAGNDGLCMITECPFKPSGAMFPASYPWVLGVQASQQSSGLCGLRACWSNYDPSGPTSVGNPYGYNYEVLAPGSAIYSTIPGNGYRYLSGTSMATPITAGGVALIKSYLPNISTEELFARIIQASGSGVLDIEGAMTIQLTPNVKVESFTILDTLTGCDRDGRADAGETVLINVKLKNYGGWAQNVKAELSLGEFEDKSVTVFIDSVSSFQNLSSYAQVNNNDNPFKITIPEDIANNRDIVFTIKTKADNWLSTNSKNQIVTIESGIEFSGIYEGKITLTANKYYIVNDPFVCDTLILEPGATLRIGDRIYVNEWLEANGKPDSLVSFLPNVDNYWTTIKSKTNENLRNKHNYNYSIFEKISTTYLSSFSATVWNSIFNDVDVYFRTSAKFGMFNSIITKSKNFANGWNYSFNKVCNTIIINNQKLNANGSMWDYIIQFRPNQIMVQNSIFNNYSTSIQKDNINQIGIQNNQPFKNYRCPPNFVGTGNPIKFDDFINDFYDNGELSPLLPELLLTKPPLEAHGHVWQVQTNEINPYDEQFDPVGSESVKFDVYFNRAMDTNFTPFLTFGVREPYTQNVVIDSAKWISWKQVENEGDTYYHLQVSDKSDFSNLIIDKNDILDLNFKYDLNGNKEYFWKVRYKNGSNGSWNDWSEAKSFKTKQTRKAKIPHIIYPINNDITVNNTFFLLLEDDLFVKKYYCELATDANFTNIIISDSIETNRKYIQNLNANQTYFVRAKSINTLGISDFSNIVQFKTKDTNSYSAPILLTPANNDTIYNLTNKSFKWNFVPWSIKYQIQISTSTAFTSLIHDSFINDTSLTFFENLSTKIKYWRVKAFNGNIETPWSQVNKFTIPAKTVNISLDSVFTYNLITYNGSSLDSNEITILPDGTYYWRFGTENTFHTFNVVNKKCQTNIPIDKAKWMDTNVVFRWNNGPKANTVYNARWQAYHTMDFTTGDGLQMIRVAGAKDNEGFEIPIEWNRFEFEVQATAALSNDFIANGDIGKIELEWGMPDAERDILGFNMYRFVQKDSVSWGDTVKVNNILITDSTFTDYDIIPDSTYFYVYRIVRTTLDEGEDSRVVSASAYPTVLSAPNLYYPPDDTTKMPVSITFDWDEPSGATEYIIQIARDNMFNDIVFDENISESQFSANGLSNRQEYFWRVKADGIQGTSGWSEIRSFNTIPVLPSIPVLAYPTNNSVSMPQNIMFDWENASEADSYQLQIADDSYFGNIIYDISNIIPSYRYISNLGINKTYYWRVRSRNVAGSSAWANKWLFTTDTAGAAAPPTSWDYTDFTGNSSAIVVPTTIDPQINGRDILPGDAVGVFYTDNGQYKSAGYGIWDGTNLAITVWGDDEQTDDKDGFSDSEIYKIKLWDSRAEKEFTASVNYSIGNSYYTTNGYSVLGMLESTDIVEHTISMRQGWNMISSYVIPENDSIQYVFAPISNYLLIVKNSKGKLYVPSYQINTIGKWNFKEGYQAYLTQNQSLIISGYESVPENDSIPLSMGWNNYAYLRNSAMNIELAMQSVVTKLLLVKNNAGKLYVPSYSINTIGSMIPSDGYMGYFTQNINFAYPANSSGKEILRDEILENVSLIPEFEATGSDMTLIIEANYEDATEIGVYNTDGMLIGSGIFQNGKAGLTIWGDDEYTEAKDGAAYLEVLSVKVLENGNLIEKEVEYSDGTELTFVKGGFVVGKINVATVENTLKVTPNPATDKLTIELPNEEMQLIEIRDMKGKLILELSNDNVSNEINISNFTNGTYFITITTERGKYTEKFVKVK